MDGKFILYEWGRPYLNWAPDVDWMAPSAAKRLETDLYKVDTTADEPTSEYLFHPNAGATYWLGDLSPDNRKVAVFELDHDDNSVRAGVYDLEFKKHTWFKLRPDEGQLGEVTPWLNEDEFLYPIKEGNAKRALANAKTGEAQLCMDCTRETVRKVEAAAEKAQSSAKARAAKIETPDLPKGAQLLAGSANGQIGVYALDTPEMLSLMFVQPGYSVWKVFQNPRQWPRPKPKE